MKTALLSLCLFAGGHGFANGKLFVKDGQVTGYKLQVFAQGVDLTEANMPLISFDAAHFFVREHEIGIDFRSLVGEDDPKAVWDGLSGWVKPAQIFPGQVMTFTEDKKEQTLTGTLLLFDLTEPVTRDNGTKPLPEAGFLLGRWYNPVARVYPQLTFTPQATDGEPADRRVLVTGPIHVGNRIAAYMWSLLLVLIALVLIFWYTRKMNNALGFLKTGDVYSLSRVQVAAWTFVVGWTVIAEGLLQISLPEIPGTLVVLMGLSLGTTVVQSTKENKARAQGEAPAAGDREGFLTEASEPSTDPEISLAKVQMLFWTVLMIAMFTWKTLMEGRLWPVPTEMVVLMGASQSGYLFKDLGATKAAPSKAREGAQP